MKVIGHVSSSQPQSPYYFQSGQPAVNRAPCEAGAGSGVSEGRPQWLFTWAIRVLTLIRAQRDDAGTATLAGLPLISNCHSKVDILLLCTISLPLPLSLTGGGAAHPGRPSGEKQMRGDGCIWEEGAGVKPLKLQSINLQRTPMREDADSCFVWEDVIMVLTLAAARNGRGLISINTRADTPNAQRQLVVWTPDGTRAVSKL